MLIVFNFTLQIYGFFSIVIIFFFKFINKYIDNINNNDNNNIYNINNIIKHV
jgi:hypothetical protein